MDHDKAGGQVNFPHDQVTDAEPRGYGWAPGDYMGECRSCRETFIGAKRAFSCHPCAVEKHKQAQARKADCVTLHMPEHLLAFFKQMGVFVDFDGVLPDYEAGLRRLGFKPDPAYNQGRTEVDEAGNAFKDATYAAIHGTDFYSTLPLMPGAKELWAFLLPCEPTVLTASPSFSAHHPVAAAGDEDVPFDDGSNPYLNPYFMGALYNKRLWADNMLYQPALMTSTIHPNPVGRIRDEKFICCLSHDKHKFMRRSKSPLKVLIDDRFKNCQDWVNAGGTAILHKPGSNFTQRALIRLAQMLHDGETIRPTLLAAEFPRSKQPKVNVSDLVRMYEPDAPREGNDGDVHDH